MKQWILMVILAVFLVSCSNYDSANDGSSIQADNERYEALMRKYDEQAARTDAQLDRAEKQADRYEAVLKRWEKQADRYDFVLEKWETGQQAAKQNNDHTALCTVSDTLAIAKIPIIPQNSFAWYKKDTPDNVLEFKCNISINQYDFGYYLFKYPDSEEQRGSIEQLLLSGQFSIRKKEGNSFSVVEGHGLSVDYSAPYIVMKITEKSTIELLFKEHPSLCSYSVVGFKAPKSDGNIEIHYR